MTTRNALDAAEEAGTAPVICIEVSDKHIVITDNGPGIPDEAVAGISDFSVRVFSREAYVSPTRGAQGNALKTILAMAFLLDGAKGETLIESRGIAHRISFKGRPSSARAALARVLANQSRSTPFDMSCVPWGALWRTSSLSKMKRKSSCWPIRS